MRINKLYKSIHLYKQYKKKQLEKLNQIIELIGQISVQGNELTEFNVLLKTRVATEKTLGSTIKLEKHLIKLNDTHGLNFYDTPWIFSFFKQYLNQDIIQSVDIIACFPNSEQNKEYIKELL